MSYLIFELFYSEEGTLSFLRLLSYISFRAILAFVAAFIISLLFGKRTINALLKNGIREEVREYEGITSRTKKGTPTMGGLLIIVSILIPVILCCNLASRYVQLLILALVWFGLIGAWDDLLKIKHEKSDKGLSRSRKLLLQGLFGLIFGFILLHKSTTPYDETIIFNLYVPFYKKALLNLGWFYLPFIIFVIISIANAVNFADGLDGLAIVPATTTAAVYGVFAYVLGNFNYSNYLLFNFFNGSGEITVFCAAVIGAGLGFLWYNAYPAQIFMGDTGSQALGGLIASMAILIKQEFLFLIAGGIFLAEAFSVLIQDRIGIGWLGRRLFYRAPLHHSFQHRGIAETTVVVRFWIISIFLALLSVVTLKVR